MSVPDEIVLEMSAEIEALQEQNQNLEGALRGMVKQAEAFYGSEPEPLPHPRPGNAKTTSSACSALSAPSRSTRFTPTRTVDTPAPYVPRPGCVRRTTP